MSKLCLKMLRGSQTHQLAFAHNSYFVAQGFTLLLRTLVLLGISTPGFISREQVRFDLRDPGMMHMAICMHPCASVVQ